LIDLVEQIEEIQFELNQRRWVYKRRVELGKMTQENADKHMKRMEEVLRTLRELHDKIGDKQLSLI
jgi:hypothetical protein